MEVLHEYADPKPFVLDTIEELRKRNIKIGSTTGKVGDTVSDIIEGKNAGVISVGVLEGSSIMGLSFMEYESLLELEKEAICEKTSAIYHDCGADYVIKNMGELLQLIDIIEYEN